jgi:hypothetical protein
MEKNRIWLVKSHEPLPILGQSGRLFRTGAFSKILTEYLNYEVEWFTSSFDHYQRIFHPTNALCSIDKVKLRIISTPGYKKNKSFKRLYDHLIFGLKFFIQAKNRSKPGLIICSFPTFSSGLFVMLYCKIYKVKYIIDYRDHWPEVFWENSKGVSRILIRIATLGHVFMTKLILKQASAIISISNYVLSLAEKKTNRDNSKNLSIYIPYLKIQDHYDLKSIPSEIVNFYNGDTNDQTLYLAYIGTVGYLGDVETILKFSQQINSSDNIKIIVCGTGDKLEDWRNNYKSDNLLFTGYVGENIIRYVLKMSNIGILSYKNHDVWQKSIPNKFIEYLSEGLYLVNPLEKGLIFDEINSNSLGIHYTEGDPLSFYNAIKKVTKQEIEDSKNERLEYFQKTFSPSITINKLKELINSFN